MAEQVIKFTNITLNIPQGAYYMTFMQDDQSNFVIDAPEGLSLYQNEKIYSPTDKELCPIGSAVHWIYVTKNSKVILLEVPIISTSKDCAKQVREYILNSP